jgi:hypothetical protein
VFKWPSSLIERDFIDRSYTWEDPARARVVAPVTMQRCDRVVCLVVSLCQDYADVCVKTMYCGVNTMNIR